MANLSLFKNALALKGITIAEFATRIGNSPRTLYNMMARDNIKFSTAVKWAELLGCRVVLQDIKTGEIYTADKL